jgi:hypothetical protein
MFNETFKNASCKSSIKLAIFFTAENINVEHKI